MGAPSTTKETKVKASSLIIILSILNAAVYAYDSNWDAMAGWISATFGWLVVLGKEMKEQLTK